MANLRFAPFKIEQEPRPDWWKVRPQEIIDLCKSVKRGRAEVIAETPAGLPVYAVFYGDFSEPAPQSNWSAGSSSSTYRSYCARELTEPQTFLFLAGIHGAEAESVCAAVNLIQMLETGKDFRGKTDPVLTDLIAKYRFIVIPCANMDGRAISPDHLHKADYETFRGASQGIWKDGTLVGWRGSKEFYPLPLDKVQYPGGYPNSEGHNIMHDACPGHIRTAEARGILQMCERYCVDGVLNGHSCEYTPSLIVPCILTYPAHAARGARLTGLVNQAFYEAGLSAVPVTEPPKARGTGFNLNTMITFASGAFAQTLECSVGAWHDKCEFARKYTFDDLIEPNYITLRIMLKDGLETPFCDRSKLVQG